MGGMETAGMPGFRDGIGSIVVVASYLHVRIGSVFLVVANQEREKLHLENPVAHDTQAAIKTAVDAIRCMIKDTKA